MNRFERVLVLLMRIWGVILLTAMIPMVMPFAWMVAIHRHLGIGELPEGPILGYLTRSLSAMYAFHGALLLFLSLDVRRYLPVVKFLAVLCLLCGIGLVVLDVAVGVPLFWILSEGPFAFVAGCVLLWLAGHVQEPSHAEQRDEGLR